MKGPVYLFDGENKQLIENENMLDYARIQIGKNNWDNYSIIFKGETYPINPNGRIEPWPSGLFTLNLKQKCELFKGFLKENE